MIFNLREAGTEICEGSEERRSRIEHSSTMHLKVLNPPSFVVHQFDLSSLKLDLKSDFSCCNLTKC